jgi:FkbM family methyltransferase
MVNFASEGNVDQVVREQFFQNNRSGVFVEVGAARPDYLSISASYRERGWKIIAVEPNPAYQDLYKQFGIEVLPYACGGSDEDGVDFSVVDSHGADYEGGRVTYESFSSLSIKDSYAALKPNLDVKTIKVNLRRLDTIMAQHAPDVRETDIVSVDVEGWELEVLRGLSFSQYKPKVLIIENIFSDKSYRDFMEDRGYHLWRTLQPNEIYVREDILTFGGRFLRAIRNYVTALWAD